MKAVVINCSSTPTHACYNLGARKLGDWLLTQDYEVASYDGDPGLWELDSDLVCLSVIFSWHAPLARTIALRLKDRAEIWAGGPGLFALDETRELADVARMMQILKDVPRSRKRVYCLVGNEPIQACYERACKIIEWGGEPHCQFVLPLNWLGDPARVKLRHDWQSYQQGRDFCRYFNTWGWRSYPLWEYKPRLQESCPFAFLQTRKSATL